MQVQVLSKHCSAAQLQIDRLFKTLSSYKKNIIYCRSFTVATRLRENKVPTMGEVKQYTVTEARKWKHDNASGKTDGCTAVPEAELQFGRGAVLGRADQYT